jgi:hypothetical protein
MAPSGKIEFYSSQAERLGLPSLPVHNVDKPSPYPLVLRAWSGDRMTFRVRALGQVAAGGVDVADDHVQLQVTLPWLLHKFAQVVQQTIAGRGRIALEKK